VGACTAKSAAWRPPQALQKRRRCAARLISRRHLCRENFEARRITATPAATKVAALQRAGRRSATLRDAPYRAFVKLEGPIVSAADQDKQRSR
jgi:hypothetical protein